MFFVLLIFRMPCSRWKWMCWSWCFCNWRNSGNLSRYILFLVSKGMFIYSALYMCIAVSKMTYFHYLFALLFWLCIWACDFSMVKCGNLIWLSYCSQCCIVYFVCTTFIATRERLIVYFILATKEPYLCWICIFLAFMVVLEIGCQFWMT